MDGLSLAAVLGVGAVAVGSIQLARVHTQAERDHYRRHYLVTFPRDFSFDASLAFMRSVSGLITPRMARLGGVLTLVFETEADDRGIRYRIAVPAHKADYVVGQLRGKIPGVHVDPVEAEHLEPWDEIIELGMRGPNHPLRIGSPPDTVNTILNSLMPMKAGEALLMQWILAPANPELPDPKDKGEREKQADNTFQAVGRIAARAQSPGEARRLAQRVYGGLGSLRAYGVTFRRRVIPQALLQRRLTQRISPVGFPCLLNATEAAVLLAFPAGGPNVPGLPQGQSRQLPADPAIPVEGIRLGVSNYPGGERWLAISPTDLLRHMWIGGPTGSGKSVTLHNIAVQIMEQGYGMILLEPKGDLVEDVLQSIPKSRRDDVILFDPSDTYHPIGLNILADTDPERITGHIVALFKSIYGDSWGPRLEYILRYAVLTAALNNLSLYDVKQLLISPSFRRGVVRNLKNPHVREFWTQFERFNDNASDSVVNKLDGFLGYSVIRNIVGQQKSGFDMWDIMSQGKILLVPLTGGLVGDANASMLGSLFVSLAWQTARGRAGMSRDQRQPFYLMIDEFQNYLNLPLAMNDALAQARGLGLGMILANQGLYQLKGDVKPAVMTNTASKIVFSLPADDARAIAHEFSPYLETTDLQTLGRYEAVLKLMTDGLAVPPATAHMAAPPKPTGAARAIREASRAAYGRPVAEVEAELRARHKSLSEDVKRPSVGRVEEGNE